MPGRSRSTKKLAQRIDLNYFKRAYPIPRWRRILSAGLTAVALLWLGWEGLAGKQHAYSAGPMAHSHAILTRNCRSCHAGESALGAKVTDAACLGCHDGPVHHLEQAFTPPCAECHVEHRGAFRLASTRDESCTQCHAKFGARITSFESGHPEFAVLRSADPGGIKFGHQMHLKKDLRGLSSGRVRLTCADCHVRAGAAILPIDYQKHCAECHGLQFDQRFSEPAPHKKPEMVVEYITERFTKYVGAHPSEVHLADSGGPLRSPLPPAGGAAEWISRRVADSEQLLFRKSCRECHALKMFDGALPEVPPAAIRTRWFDHAMFDHRAHQMLECEQCHPRAATSRDTADVLLPGIATCRSCHHSGANAAEARCSECHAYHDWSKEKKTEGKFTIKSFSQD